MGHEKCNECGCHLDAHSCGDQAQHLELRERILNLEADLNVAQRKRAEAEAAEHLWTQAECKKNLALIAAEKRNVELTMTLRWYAGYDHDGRVVCNSRTDAGRRAKAVLCQADHRHEGWNCYDAQQTPAGASDRDECDCGSLGLHVGPCESDARELLSPVMRKRLDAAVRRVLDDAEKKGLL